MGGTGCNMGACCIPPGDWQTCSSWEAPQCLLECPSHIPHLAQWKGMSKGFQLFLFQSVSVSSLLRKSHEAVALISIWIRNVNTALPYTRKGPSLWKGKGRKHWVCVCLWNTHCERKVISCQNPNQKRSSEDGLILERISMQEAKPWLHFQCHFQLCFMKRSGSYVLSHRRLSMMVWYPFTSKFTVASNLPSC